MEVVGGAYLGGCHLLGHEVEAGGDVDGHLRGQLDVSGGVQRGRYAVVAVYPAGVLVVGIASREAEEGVEIY